MYTNKDIKSKEMVVYKKVSKINELYFTKTNEPINLMDKFLEQKLENQFILIKDGFNDEFKNTTILYVSKVEIKNEKSINIIVQSEDTTNDFLLDLSKEHKIMGYELKPILEYYNVSPFKQFVPYENYLENFVEVLSN